MPHFKITWLQFYFNETKCTALAQTRLWTRVTLYGRYITVNLDRDSFENGFPWQNIEGVCSPLLFVISVFLCASAEHWPLVKKIISHESHMIAQTTIVFYAPWRRFCYPIEKENVLQFK